ncbi:MAG: caspase family protein [Rubrivivax sp.]|nr:caspase family protein [Rubrivivax sp.]
MNRSLSRAAVIVAMSVHLAAPMPAQGAECFDWFRITLAGGTRACLTDLPLANDSVAGQISDVRRNIPRNGYYSLAATPALPQCQRVVGIGAVAGAITATGIAADSDHRNQKALQDCHLRNRGASAECQCRLLLVDGTSSLSAAEFARYSGAPGAPAGTAAAAAPSPPPGAPPVAAAAPAVTRPATPLPTPAVTTSAITAAPTGPGGAAPQGGGPRADTNAAEIAALRQQVDSLRSEVTQARQAAATAAPRKAQRARALVVGNGRYATFGALPNPTRDAEAMAARLRKYGIDVDLHLNLDRTGLVRALSEFQRRATGYDVNLFFYAGHGLQVGGVNYIVPVDMSADAATAANVKLNTVSLDDALEYLPSTTRVVFLDACRDNPVARSLRGTRSGSGLGLAPVSAVSGTLLSYATRDGSTAEDGRGANSPYTAALLQHLDAPDDIALVLRRVRQSVLQATGQRQEPWEYGSLVGDTLVVSKLGRK